ncbi:MAG: translation initiation factor Sui1 [marine benthic group bacterium]|jgi:translation initiation factor 1|nr:translation initiation factor Sui1 [Gemmatimonadota bacterium]MCL7962544.1 translation initiation factor Sui1 [Candidatus Carthagonibacter metallireducens]MCL7968450.1 translation initiation factor Sui1 [Gemmatimonadota bacterium]MCL7982901.1 translation initiation factor Sui1 [Gemmatimonadota bacterium]MCL7984105.1 translation initiation factor Sui1 [Gemmatimonadota bacterium]
MSDRRRDGGLVYSTDFGRTCPRCRRAIDECRCAQRLAGKRPNGDGVARVGRETKGRKGKGVTVVKGLTLSDAELADLAKRLKKKCGSGGTVRNGVIEIQGDHRDMIVTELETLGHRAKRAGG